MNRASVRSLLWVCGLVAMAVLVLLPVFRPGLLVTDDGGWMVIRLSAFFQSLREGQFPVRFLGRLNQSYGYPVANFLYPGFLYIGSLLHLFGFSFQSSVEAIVVCSVIGGAVATFFWLRRFFDAAASGIGALSFLLAPYLLYDVYKRGSVGEVLALGICMVVLYAIESKKTWLVPFATALLSISHNTLALFFLPILFLYIVLRGYRNLLVPFLLGIGMSSFFWIPAIMEQKNVLLTRVTVSNPFDFFKMSGVIAAKSLPFAAASVMVLLRKRKVLGKIGWFFFLLLVLTFFFATPASSLLWQNNLFGTYVQFPYRWLSLLCFVGPWLIASLAHGKNAFFRMSAIVFIVIFFVLSLQYLKSDSIVRPEGFFTTNEGTTTVADEYLPRWVDKKLESRAAKRLDFFSGGGTIVENKATTQKIDATVTAQGQSVIQVNSLYYPGWGATLDNEKIEIAHDNPNGLIRITIPEGKHRLYMEFRETPTRFLADIASIVSFILAIIVLL